MNLDSITRETIYHENQITVPTIEHIIIENP